MTRTLGHKLKHFLTYLDEEHGFLRSFPFGSMPDIERNYPKPKPSEVVADLHCHPFFETYEDIFKIWSSTRKNKVNLLGLTKHIGSKEKDFWDFRGITSRLNSGYVDQHLMVVHYPAFPSISPTGFVGNYETTVQTSGLKPDASLDMLALMPDAGFGNKVKHNMPLHEFLDLAHEYNAITLAAHLCVLPSNNTIPFRSPDEEEVAYLKEEVMPKVDGADEVADAAAWMTYSWNQSDNNFPNSLRSSDAHTRVRKPFNKIPGINPWISWYLRNEIGRAYTMFDFSDKQWYDLEGTDLREKLRQDIRDRSYRAKGDFTPAGQFFLGTALPNSL